MMSCHFLSKHLKFLNFTTLPTLQPSSTCSSSIVNTLMETNDEATANISRKKIKIGIIGAGIAGCVTAYFLESLLCKDESIDLEIDIFERASDIGGRFSAKLEYEDCEYDMNPVHIDFTQAYMKNFLKESKLDSPKTETYSSGLFDTNGVVWSIENTRKFISLKTVRYFIVNFGFSKSLKIAKFLISYLYYRYKFQDQGYSFSNIEKLIRKIDPSIFTLSQHTIAELFKKEQDLINNEIFEHLTSLACFNILEQNANVHVIAAISSFLSSFCSYRTYIDTKKICEHILKDCRTVRLVLNSHVKLVGYNKINPNSKNTLTFTNHMKYSKKSYDYVVITFPLTKDIKNQNFWLDILYRDFLDCEMHTSMTYVVDGHLAASFTKNPLYNLINFHSKDASTNVQSIKSIKPINKPNELLQINQKILYRVVLSNNSESSYAECLDKLFIKGYKIVCKASINNVPLYKKSRYTHTPFPSIVIDEIKRSRVFYLNGLEWLDSSKESDCIAARNIAYLIAKREISSKTLLKQILNDMEKFNYFHELKHCLFTSFFLLSSLIGFSYLIRRKSHLKMAS